MVEIWKSVKNYEGIYEISSLGNVKSFMLYPEGRLLKPGKNSRGYMLVVLSKKGLKKKNYHIHRLVAEAFVDNLFEKDNINHINGIKLDNRRENLEWVTQSENVKHGYKVLGVKPNKPWLGKTGYKNPSSTCIKIKTPEGLQIDFGSISECSRKIGIAHSIISRIINYKNLPYVVTKGRFKGLSILEYFSNSVFYKQQLSN